MFNNLSIMITGGTGSFGHSFTELIIKKYKPKKLIIFSETNINSLKCPNILPKKINF